MSEQIVVGRRFRGPQRSANGGYASGLVASLLDAEAVEVTLRLPPPLDRPLAVVREAGRVRVLHGDALVAEARPADPDVDPPPAPSFAEAEALAAAVRDDADHPFPDCFVCGPAREEGDALRLRIAPAGNGTVVAPWRPTEALAGPGPEVPRELVWAALDCPGAFACNPDLARGASVLGRLTAHVHAVPNVGEECVVVGWPLGGEGRKLGAGTALYRGGRLLAEARAVWFLVGPESRDG